MTLKDYLKELNKIKGWEETSAIAVIEDALTSQMERNENSPTDYGMYAEAAIFFRTLVEEHQKLSNQTL